MSYSIGQMAQLARAFERVGFTAQDVTALTQYEDLGLLRRTVSGFMAADFVGPIESDYESIVPNGFSMAHQARKHRFVWDSSQVELFHTHTQRFGNEEGVKIRSALVENGRFPLDATVLDLLERHQGFIPESWRHQKVFFWGTTYKHIQDGDLYVRFLERVNHKWESGIQRVGSNDFSINTPAAVSTSIRPVRPA